jgi:hypothetical protein
MLRQFVFCISLTTVAVQAAKSIQYVSPGQPPVECMATTNYEFGAELPGYLVRDPGGETCVGFSFPGVFAPAGARDWYAQEFSDAAIKARYTACLREASCREKLKGIPPLVAVPHEYRATGTAEPSQKMDPHSDIDLRVIRRPSYFGLSPWSEPIAQADAATWVVEFRVPRESYERLRLKKAGTVALRGWYLQGPGVENDRGEKVRALVVLVSGRSVETTALANPEHAAAPGWRNLVFTLNRAGFDVFTFDKRGHGISGGYNDVDTLEQGRDMWRALDALETGRGVRALSPAGKLLEGDAVRGVFLAGMKARQVPVIFGGASQGSIATAWAMHQNFVGDCTFELREVRCSPPRGYNVKGALLLSSVLNGISGRPAPVKVEDGALDEARSRVEHSVVMLTSSEPMTHINTWPAVFLAKGLWDFAESLEATLGAYQRVDGLKEFVVVRGPHSDIEMNPASNEHVATRMVAFSRAALFGLSKVPGAASFKDLKSLVGSSPPPSR